MATHQFSPKTTTDPNQQQYSPNRTYCCCFPTRWRKISSSSSDEPSHQTNPTLWSRGITALKKLREWSEIVAGPKWKTFIRRFNHNKHSSSSAAKYQYDPHSYALNFDQDPLQTADPETENEYLIRNFSSRYVMPPSATAVPVSGPNFV